MTRNPVPRYRRARTCTRVNREMRHHASCVTHYLARGSRFRAGAKPWEQYRHGQKRSHLQIDVLGRANRQSATGWGFRRNSKALGALTAWVPFRELRPAFDLSWKLRTRGRLRSTLVSLWFPSLSLSEKVETSRLSLTIDGCQAQEGTDLAGAGLGTDHPFRVAPTFMFRFVAGESGPPDRLRGGAPGCNNTPFGWRQ